MKATATLKLTIDIDMAREMGCGNDLSAQPKKWKQFNTAL